jgi:type I restriction enzyme S subunit
MPRPTKKLGEVCQIQKGKKPHLYQESDPGCLPYLTAEVLRNGIAKQFASISDRNSVRVSEKEIIIICDGSNSGDVFFGYDGILASTMGKLVHSQEIYTKYLYLFLKQNFEYLNTDKVGAATPHLNQEKFKNLETPLPPLPEQKKIVDYLDDLREKIEKLKQLQQKQLEELNELKNSILEKAFTSELIH